MSDTMERTELTDLDELIGDLETRITETELPETEAHSGHCSNVCTVLVCGTVVICS
ncbi:hypothetical protein [Streptomyces sp. NPDC018045]|uniref:hypothetical protein n=1 Tax=Streptomyces sp. NPDC018045 TaxID=3365037 RepID=UPI00378D2DA2